MDRIEASRAEAARLRRQSVSEVTPSRRDFAQYVAGGRDEPAVVARLSLATTGWSREQLLEHARACDDAEVAALSLSLLDDLSVEDLAAVVDDVTAPILREDPLLDANQLYYSRLHGADAVVLPAAVLAPDELGRMVDVAVSMHMSVVIECESRAAVEAAVRWPYTIIGARSLEAASEVSRYAPAKRTIVLLADVATPEEYKRARGVCDTVIVAPRALVGGDVAGGIDVLRGTGA